MADDARQQAIDRIKAKRGFWSLAGTLSLSFVVLVIIWAASGAGFFWPVFPLLGFIIALGSSYAGAFGHHGISEEQVQQEMARQKDSVG